MIYGLTNERGKVRYVGRSVQKPESRLKAHIRESKNNDTSKDEWIRKIGKENIEVILLEENPKNEARAEVWWMEYMEFLGFELTNEVRYEMRTRNGWEPPKEVVELMGKIPDWKVGKKFDLTESLIFKYRKRLGISCCSSKIKLPDECINQLGQKPDRELGEEYNVSAATIFGRRKERGISSYTEQKNNLPNECYEKMGQVSDRELSRNYDVSRKTISRRRSEAGIKKYKAKCELPEECYEKMGNVSDRTLGREYDVCTKTIGNKRRKAGIEAYKK